LVARPTRFLGHDGTLQAAEVSIVEQPAEHLLRDLFETGLIEFVTAGEFHSDVEPGQRRLHAGCNEGIGFRDHDGTAISIAIVQPKEGSSAKRGGTASM
jgi:hypothetical protein